MDHSLECYSLTGYDFYYEFPFDKQNTNESKLDCVADLNEYNLKRSDIDEYIDDYLYIIRIFEEVIFNADIFNNIY